MKKLVLIIGAVAMLGLYSCSKKVDCTCVTTGGGGMNGSTSVSDYDGECSDMNVSIEGMSVTCTED